MSAISSGGRTEPGKTPSSAASSSFLDDIRIDFGPSGLLGRFFLAADAAVQERGVRLSFAPMEQLVEINRENPQSWRPLLPHYDPKRVLSHRSEPWRRYRGNPSRAFL